jgi:hypothetical protein
MSQRLRGTIKFTSSPSNLGFDVFAKYNGVEHKLTMLAISKGESISAMTASLPPVRDPPPVVLDVILRASRKAASGTMGVYDIWQGQIVFPDVPVKTISPTTQQ